MIPLAEMVTKSESSKVNVETSSKTEAAANSERSKTAQVKSLKSNLFPEDLKPGQIYSDPNRAKWEEHYNCILSMIGFAVGLSNIWRFPYLCFVHGGGSFLIPYFFFLFVCVIPVLYLEVIVGQFTQSGMISMWRLVPIVRGLLPKRCIYSLSVAGQQILVLLKYFFRSWNVPNIAAIFSRFLLQRDNGLGSTLLC